MSYIVTWTITAKTLEQASNAHEIAKNESEPDRVVTFIVRAFPNGIEKRYEEKYRIGDYFDKIEISDVTDNSFEIAFYVREGVISKWKDLSVGLLSKMREAGCEVTHLRNESKEKSIL